MTAAGQLDLFLLLGLFCLAMDSKCLQELQETFKLMNETLQLFPAAEPAGRWETGRASRGPCPDPRSERGALQSHLQLSAAAVRPRRSVLSQKYGNTSAQNAQSADRKHNLLEMFLS